MTCPKDTTRLFFVIADRRLTGRVPQGPERLKPGVVAHLPEPGVDDVEMRPHELLVGQVADELEGALARIHNPFDQLFYRGHPSDIAVHWVPFNMLVQGAGVCGVG